MARAGKRTTKSTLNFVKLKPSGHAGDAQLLHHIRDRFTPPADAARAPLSQATLGTCRFLSEDRVAAAACFCPNDQDTAKVVLTRLAWVFVDGRLQADATPYVTCVNL